MTKSGLFDTLVNSKVPEYCVLATDDDDLYAFNPNNDR